MDGWVHGFMDSWTIRWIDGQACGWTDVWIWKHKICNESLHYQWILADESLDTYAWTWVSHSDFWWRSWSWNPDWPLDDYPQAIVIFLLRTNETIGVRNALHWHGQLPHVATYLRSHPYQFSYKLVQDQHYTIKVDQFAGGPTDLGVLMGRCVGLKNIISREDSRYQPWILPSESGFWLDGVPELDAERPRSGYPRNVNWGPAIQWPQWCCLKFVVKQLVVVRCIRMMSTVYSQLL